ncbi:MAG: polysaccharide deacetylase family protein [Gemmatimonadales bacterium]|nr:polysaccharide deacetylase family protein [Gemmatimonadales bacterium]
MNPADVTVLCYHRISRWPLPAGTWVGPGQLARQLDVLLEAGVRFISPADYHHLITAPVLCGEDPTPFPASTPQVLVTFDDGTVDIHCHREILAGRGIRPLVFMPSAFLGRQNSWEWPIPGRRIRHLCGDQLRELAAAGWEIGLHGASHCDLTRLAVDRLTPEIAEARAELQEAVGRPVRFFSYPFGRAAPPVASRIQAEGFTAAFILAAHGPVQGKIDLFHLARRPVYCIDSPADVLAKVMDPTGRTGYGRWQHWKERAAHGVGRWTAGRLLVRH